ncbi:MAG: peptide-methionine (S)-S-oxide reductase MsrA, partial [Burkholderiales bacterium]
LAGGCFWCIEVIYDELIGVTDVVSGYMGGKNKNPTYREVCSGNTGHAEVIQVTFDPSIVSYRQILDVFFTIHDPTTLNRQGNDVGTQYRSAVFYHSEEQQRVATDTIAEFNQAKIWDRPIVTEVTAAQIFYPAESYHQEYYVNNPEQGYCQIIIAPKVAKFRQKFLSRLKRT